MFFSVFSCILSDVMYWEEAYLEPYKTSMMKIFRES